MFQTQGFIVRKKVVYAGMVSYVLHAFIVISACKTYYNVPVYTAFLKTNPRV